MWDLKACMVCFSTEVKLFSMSSGQLRHEYNIVSGLQTNKGSGIPDYLCVECSAYVRHFKKFRDKCQRAHYILLEMLQQNKEIKKSNLKDFDRQLVDIMPTLSYMNLDRTRYEEVKFQWVKQCRDSIGKMDSIPIAHCSTLTKEDTFQAPILKQTLACGIIKENVKIEFEDDNKRENREAEKRVEGIENNGKSEEPTSMSDEDQVGQEFLEPDNNFDSDDDSFDVPCKLDDKVDGSKFDEEYATLYPISVTEAKAAVEVYKMFSRGKYQCDVCCKSLSSEQRLATHARMHDKYISGTFHCELCKNYYKTDFLLQTHMTEKHMYKYICSKCPEVNFDRISAKQHYIWVHLQQCNRKNSNWYDSRPSWLSGRGGRRVKGVVSLRPVRKLNKLPADFLTYTPIGHDEQYEIVRARRNTRNYIDAQYKCEHCYRGFRLMVTYNKHMKKHDPGYSGNLQCDMCKLYYKDQRSMYRHMIITHLFKYTCQMCSYVCYNRGQAHMHYRWHKNVTYQCPHCDKEFMKASTRLTHIRIKHPSMNICNMCGHSFVSESGLYCHKQIAHGKKEIQDSELVPVNKQDPYYCADCSIHFLNEAAFTTHLGSSIKHASTNISIKPDPALRRARPGQRKRGRPRRLAGDSEILNNGMTTSTNCEVCGKFLVNDVQARKHYESEHPGAEFLKRYMCDVCGHTTRQYANLMVHMRTHTNEKPYECPHCDRRFSMPSNRDRHLVVHTGEKRYQCQHCSRRFTQSSAVKLHIQTVHLKIPYAPWDKKNRKRRKELEGAASAAPAPAPGAGPAPAPAGPHAELAHLTGPCAPHHKLLLDSQGDYLNAYITYNDE